MSSWSVRTLGPLEVLVDGCAVPLGGHKQRVVLALLALRAPAVVSTDELVEAVWPDDLPQRPSVVLKVYVANLRRVLKPGRGSGALSTRLVGHADGYSLDVSVDDLDLFLFGRLLVEGRDSVTEGDMVEGARQLKLGLALWRGNAFPDLVDVATVEAELAALEERRLTALEDTIHLDLAMGRHADVVADLESLIARHPYREQLRAALIVALYRSQRQAEALAACRASHQFLLDELGVDPGPVLRNLETAILRHDPVLTSRATDHRQQSRRRIDNLPAELSPLLGREAEIVEVHRLLEDQQVRLVTFCGPGGTGKTRLALAVAERLASDASDGVCFVDLAPLRDDHQVLPAIASALGVVARNPAELEAAVAAFLRPRQLIVVLDNFEHVLTAWSIPASLLTAAPKLRMLITSRTPLGISGEQQYDVGPLAVARLSPLPSLDVVAASAAIQLFVARARLVRRDFQLNKRNARSVVEICRRLDGLPLAVELAAAHARTLTPGEMLKRLEHRMSLLHGGPRDRPARHQTLQATIAWSYDALSDAERAVFAQLAVFAGAPLMTDVAEICQPAGDAATSTLDALESLVRASLIRRQHDDLGNPRVVMLQTIREFAHVELAAHQRETTLYRRHAEHFAALAEGMAAQLDGPNQASAYKRLRAEHADLYSALVWAAGPDGDIDLAFRLIGTLWHFWEITGDVTDVRIVADDLLKRSDSAPPELLGPALSGAGTFCWLQGDTSEAARLHERALATFEIIGDPSGVAWSQMCLATQAVVRSEFEQAETLATTALAAATALTDHRTSAFALLILGVVAWYQQDGPRAQALQEEALTRCRAAGDEWAAAKPLINLADIAEDLGDYDRAMMLLIDALHTSHEMGDRALAIFCVEAIAELQLRLGLPTHAARLLAACDTYRTDMVLPLDDHERQLRDDTIAEARLAAGTVNFSIAWNDGTSLSLEEATAEALTATSDS